MADEFYKKEIEAEEAATKEASREYDDLVASLILIATSNRSKKEKLSLIENLNKKMRAFNSRFSENQIEKSYNQFSREAAKEAKELNATLKVKKKLTGTQRKELASLTLEMETRLNQRLDILINQAKQLAIKEDLARIREELGMTDGEEKRQITPKKTKKEIVFMDTKGRRIKMETIMKVTVGDQMWETINSSKRSTYLRYGFRWAEHISVIDDRTTNICLALDHTIRDLTKDKIPPMHPNCRSRIKLLKDKKLIS